jgi:hypothetical protein
VRRSEQPCMTNWAVILSKNGSFVTSHDELEIEIRTVKEPRRPSQDFSSERGSAEQGGLKMVGRRVPKAHIRVLRTTPRE